ncbi:MAG: PilN domain-containing protein [bacterium]
MRLPAFFGHKRSINLLPRDEFESSTIGVVLEWSLVFGKWAVIITQLVVMGAFLYRFTLDRSLTDLRKAMAKQVTVIKSYEQVERDYVLLQKRVTQAKKALESEDVTLKAVSELMRITPSEVWFDRVSLSPDSMTLTAYAASLPGFGQFLTAVQSNPMFSGIRVGKLESSTAKGAQIQFDLSLKLTDTSSQKGSKK